MESLRQTPPLLNRGLFFLGLSPHGRAENEASIHNDTVLSRPPTHGRLSEDIVQSRQESATTYSSDIEQRSSSRSNNIGFHLPFSERVEDGKSSPLPADNLTLDQQGAPEDRIDLGHNEALQEAGSGASFSQRHGDAVLNENSMGANNGISLLENIENRQSILPNDHFRDSNAVSTQRLNIAETPDRSATSSPAYSADTASLLHSPEDGQDLPTIYYDQHSFHAKFPVELKKGGLFLSIAGRSAECNQSL